LEKLRRLTIWAQGIYTFITAVWPIVDIDSFMKVTGYKTDVWLVKTVSVLLLAFSIGLLASAFSKRLEFSIAFLALFASAGLTYVDFYYPANDIISNIYMADGVVEVVFVVAWLILLLNKKPAEAGSR
jgi:hypothetical protein